MYEKEFKIKIEGKEETFLLKPLNGAHIGKFYKVLSALSKLEGKDEKDFFMHMDEDTINTLHFLIVATIKKSYADKYKPEDLDEMVSKNLLLFLEPLLKLNMPTVE